MLSSLALFAALTMLTVSCGGGDTGQSTTGAQGGGEKGGSIVIAAEQWPECLNPVTQCSNASWMHWTTTSHVLPRAMELDAQSNFVASPILVEEPTLENGGIKESPFTITYKIKPEAVWDDGSPITSEDIHFTWRAYMETKGAVSTSGYDKIKDISTADPKTAVIEFTAPYADWWDLFGGNSGYILKKAAFQGGPELSKEMGSAIPFSGSAFKLESFDKEKAVLVRNEKYWDTNRVALLDKVTFVPRTNQDTEIQELVSGSVAAAYPQPAPAIAQRLSQPGVKFKVAAGTTYEGLWPHHGTDTVESPLADKNVREALFRAVDRQQVVDQLIKPDFPEAAVLNCAGWVPNVGKWCDNTDFADITYDPDAAKAALQRAGYECPATGACTKGGKPLQIKWSTTAGNKGREDTQQLVKQQAIKAGIDLVIDNHEPGFLFEKKLPKRDFELAEFANVASPDPSITTLYACDQIPNEENDFSGQNWLAWCDQEASDAAKQSDAVVNEEQRLQLIQKIGDRTRAEFAWLPLYQKPLIIAWREDQVRGPIDAFAASPYSGFANLYDWEAVKK